MKNIDIIIIGAGIAGLTTALKLSPKYNILLICINKTQMSASYYAQGGIATVANKKDSKKSHVQDTIQGGSYLCEKEIVFFIILNSKKSIKWLIKYNNINFTKKNLTYHLTKEGGHSFRRIFHFKDNTGQEIQKKLLLKINKKKNIFIYENYKALETITKNNIYIGIYILNTKIKKILKINTKIIILASGGYSGIYKFTTNPNNIHGEGIIMAYKKKCRISNLEFNQFHPTCLYSKTSFLLTEALRGEGAYLFLPLTKKRFMRDVDIRQELAPRDIVSKTIVNQLLIHNIKYVNLDITYKPKIAILNYFPNIYKKLKKQNFDLVKQQIPVIPGAHYTCGGIMINKKGQTDIKNLYAIGETIYSGLHGANRIASNSLLECIVTGILCAKNINKQLLKKKFKQHIVEIIIKSTKIKNNYKQLIKLITIVKYNTAKYLGIVKNNTKLQKLKIIQKIINYRLKKQFILKNCETYASLHSICIITMILLKSCLGRQENRGLYYNETYNKKIIKFEKPSIIRLCKNI